MLILTRNVKQKIIINDNIEVIVIKVKGKQVKLGIIAPKEVSVYREEIFPGGKIKPPYSPKNPTQ